MNKTNVKILKRGLKRVMLALLTTATCLLALTGFIAVAFVSGYIAVLLFLFSIVVAALAYGMLYGQGMNRRINTKDRSEKNDWNVPL